MRLTAVTGKHGSSKVFAAVLWPMHKDLTYLLTVMFPSTFGCLTCIKNHMPELDCFCVFLRYLFIFDNANSLEKSL